MNECGETRRSATCRVLFQRSRADGELGRQPQMSPDSVVSVDEWRYRLAWRLPISHSQRERADGRSLQIAVGGGPPALIYLEHLHADGFVGVNVGVTGHPVAVAPL